MRERAVLVLPVRVHDRMGLRQGLAREVVIEHDHIRARRRRNRAVAEGAAIYADDQVVPGGQIRHRRIVRTIALIDPVGDIERRSASCWRSQSISNAADAPPSTS